METVQATRLRTKLLGSWPGGNRTLNRKLCISDRNTRPMIEALQPHPATKLLD